MTNWPQLMRKSTVARYLDTSPQTVDRWVAAGALPRPYVVAGAKRWDLDELRAAICGALAGRATRAADPDRIVARLRRDKDRSQAA